MSKKITQKDINMFIQDKPRQQELMKKPTHHICDGCQSGCRISAIRDADGVIYPQIGGRILKFYYDQNNEAQIIFPYTCPTFESGIRLAHHIKQFCDNNYKQKQK